MGDVLDPMDGDSSVVETDKVLRGIAVMVVVGIVGISGSVWMVGMVIAGTLTGVDVKFVIEVA